MVFSSLPFLFAFLPVTMALYFLSGTRLRNIILLVASLFFYAWGEPVYVLLMLLSILVNYSLGLVIDSVGSSKKKLFLIVSLIFNLGCLAFFKYLGMIVGTLYAALGIAADISIPALPIGISFYTFQALSYVIDIYRGKIKHQRSLLLFALYISMFPQLVAGPIVNYSDIESQLSNRDMNLEIFYSGFRRFLCGLAKKILLANNIGLLWTEIKLTPVEEISAIMAWVGILSFSLQIYFDFSGYSDMAIGLGKMFGFHFRENFKHPYVSRSISEFWRRWHISLGTWFREYVYIPLGGNKRNLMRNLLIVWFLTGLWHGASWNFILWGLYFALLILAEKFFFAHHVYRWPAIISHIYLLISVSIGWVFFEFNKISDIVGFLRAMFWQNGNPFVNSQTIQVSSYIVLLIVCIVGTTPVPKNIATVFSKKHDGIYKVAETLYCSILMFFTTAYMVGSTYNPFIYFRF